jgi:hypothetical protein
MARKQNLLVKIMKELNEGKASNPALTAQIIDHPNPELCTCRLVYVTCLLAYTPYYLFALLLIY